MLPFLTSNEGCYHKPKLLTSENYPLYATTEAVQESPKPAECHLARGDPVLRFLTEVFEFAALVGRPS